MVYFNTCTIARKILDQWIGGSVDRKLHFAGNFIFCNFTNEVFDSEFESFLHFAFRLCILNRKIFLIVQTNRPCNAVLKMKFLNET